MCKSSSSDIGEYDERSSTESGEFKKLEIYRKSILLISRVSIMNYFKLIRIISINALSMFYSARGFVNYQGFPVFFFLHLGHYHLSQY